MAPHDSGEDHTCATLVRCLTCRTFRVISSHAVLRTQCCVLRAPVNVSTASSPHALAIPPAASVTQFVVATNYIESNREKEKPKARAKAKYTGKGYHHQHDDAAQAVEIDRSLEGALIRFEHDATTHALRTDCVHFVASIFRDPSHAHDRDTIPCPPDQTRNVAPANPTPNHKPQTPLNSRHHVRIRRQGAPRHQDRPGLPAHHGHGHYRHTRCRGRGRAADARARATGDRRDA